MVPKTDKSSYICGDYKVSVNSYVRTEGYPLPTVQDLFSAVSDGTVFSKLDLQHAYQQIEVEQLIPTKDCISICDFLLESPVRRLSFRW